MRQARLAAIVAAIAFLAAVAGVWVGRALIPVQGHQGSELHAVLHHQLKLDDGQKARIEALEQSFAVRRQALEAIEAEHGIGPRVTAAVDASHRAMGELQKETLAHIFAMREILRPDQQAVFDRAVVHALTADAR